MLPILYKSQWFTIYSYPFMMGLAWAMSYKLSEFYYIKNKVSLTNFHKYFIGLFFFSFLGAKIAYLFFSSTGLISEHFHSLSFWLGGGFVFYGGMLGALIWSYLNLKYFHFIKRKELNYYLPGAIFGHALGRVGCFLAGCCHGEHFPVQLLEALLLGFLGLYIMKKLNDKNILFFYLGLYACIRFILEFERADEIRGIIWQGLSTSQVISLVLMAFVGGRFVFASGKTNFFD